MTIKENDLKIKTLLETIALKQSILGPKPSAEYRTNCMIYDVHTVNINTITDLQTLVNVASSILMKKTAYEAVQKQFKISLADNVNYQRYVDELHDLQIRCNIINWLSEKKKLQELEKQLRDLMSADAKTSQQLSDIEVLLQLKSPLRE